MRSTHEQSRKTAATWATVILVAITAISCASSYAIYRDGFNDMPPSAQKALTVFCVICVEGFFLYTLYGYKRAFQADSQRRIALVGMAFTLAVMLLNIATHFMIVRNIELADFQQAYIQWGAISALVAILIFVLLLTLSEPEIQITIMELRIEGLRKEKILEAQAAALESERVAAALQERTADEEEKIVKAITGGGNFPKSLP